MKTFKKIIAILLAVIIPFSFSFQASAADGTSAGKPYSVWAHIVDDIFGIAHDAVFGLLMMLTRQSGIPSSEEYLAAENENFFEGTDGETVGKGWSGGFAKGSIIPTKWRCNANGKKDPNGSCLKIIRPTGGYQTFVSKLYTDQMMNMMILTCGSDANGNGIEDIIVFISVDGVGITAGTCAKIRENVRASLKEYGVCDDDILACNVSATHCHAGLDTMGMSILTLFLNKLNPFTGYDRSMSEDMEKSICAQAASCAKEAYGKIEKGSLYFFETDELDGCNDKLNCGVKTKDFFSCFLFEGKSGEKTLLTNIGAHPTSYGAWDNNRMMCTDYPYFMALALADAGCNIVFTQSSQASVSSPSVKDEYGKANSSAADAWVKSRALTKEDWVQRYGEKYTEKQFDNLEESIEGHMRKGYLLAHYIIDSVDKSLSLKPSLNIKNTRTLLSLDYGVMALGSVSGLLGENAVKTGKSETGYGVIVETNYLEFGNKVIVLTAPGELSPSLVYGTNPDYDGEALWTGKTSWKGDDWQYDTLKSIVLGKDGNSGKKFVLMGITNDELGYMYPDICTPKSLLGTLIFYKENPEDMTNCMLMTVGTGCGSELMEAYTSIIDSISAK